MNLADLKDALPEAQATLVPGRQYTPMTCKITRANAETVFDMCVNGKSFTVTVPGLLNADQCADVVAMIVKTLTD